MFSEEVVIQEWQFNSIGNLLDLGIKTPNVDITNVGHFFEQQVFDLWAGQFLEQ